MWCTFGTFKAATPEIIDKIHDIVLTDRRKCASLLKPQAYYMAQWYACSILHELSMKKINKMGAAFVVDKRDRVTISKQCLEMFQRNPDEFLRRFITVDETWIPRRTNSQNNGFHEWTSSEEGEDRKVGRKGDDHSFWDEHAV